MTAETILSTRGIGWLLLSVGCFLLAAGDWLLDGAR